MGLFRTAHVITGLYPTLDRHPLRELMAAGIHCSINSDDPAFFGNLVTEIERCVELNRNSLRHCLRGGALVEQFDAWYAAWPERRTHEAF